MEPIGWRRSPSFRAMTAISQVGGDLDPTAIEEHINTTRFQAVIG
jgi:hypothetical protein